MDPFNSNSQNGGEQGSNKRQQTQVQVAEVASIVRVNVEKILEQEKKLNELEDWAEALVNGAIQFESQAETLTQMWLRNIEMMSVVGSIVIVLVVLVILTFYS